MRRRSAAYRPAENWNFAMRLGANATDPAMRGALKSLRVRHLQLNSIRFTVEFWVYGTSPIALLDIWEIL
jgi:hypothetical protein